MEASFQELKAKQVINTVDGVCLGHITDIVFDVVCAKALGFIVPQPNQGFWGFFKGNRELFIPFDCVCKIGVDVILVELYINEKNNNPPKQKAKCCSVQAQDYYTSRPQNNQQAQNDYRQNSQTNKQQQN